MTVIDAFLKNHRLTQEEYLELLEHWEDKETTARIRAEAVKLRKQYYGNKVFLRGLIEFTNYCKNNCHYCGIRSGNTRAHRYRLSEEEILDCCENGYELGFRTFVLQGGEDPHYSDDQIVHLIRRIKDQYPDAALTLSIGEKSRESYRRFREAGADRYLLRHETANGELYHQLHPQAMSLSNRMQCLRYLKELGYQVGSGFMVGAPGQRLDHLAEDLTFLQELKPQMVGIGPFIPHHDTVYAKEKAGSVELTLFLLSVIRIMMPKVLLPATTALGTLDEQGRERGLAAGANVIMPNLSPVKNRKLYELYDNKICTGEEAAECRNCLGQRVRQVGFELVDERGDHPSVP